MIEVLPILKQLGWSSQLMLDRLQKWAHSKDVYEHLPGDPANTEKGGTTVSGGSTVLSSTLLQSFSIQERD